MPEHSDTIDRGLQFEHRLWIGQRSLGPIVAFRAAAGALLAYHFVALQYAAPDLLHGVGLFDPTSLIGAVPGFVPSWIAAGLPASALRALFAAGTLAALCIAVGVAPRVFAAAAFGLSVSTQRALFPVTHLDDLCASWLLFWLVLLPATPSLPTWLRRRRGGDCAVPGLVVNLLAVNALLIGVTSPFWSRFCPSWPAQPPIAIVAGAIAGGMLMPGALIPRLAVLAHITLHVYLATQTTMLVAHGAMIAAALLLWGEHVAVDGEAAATRPPISTAAAIGGSYLLLVCVFVVATTLSLPSVQRSSLALLGMVGLSPIAAGVRPDGPSRLIIRPLGARRGGVLPFGDRPTELRKRLLLAQLPPAPDQAGEAMRRSILTRVAQRYCDQRARRGVSATLEVSAGPSRVLQLARLECEVKGSRPHMSWFDGMSGAVTDARSHLGVARVGCTLRVRRL